MPMRAPHAALKTDPLKPFLRNACPSFCSENVEGDVNSIFEGMVGFVYPCNVLGGDFAMVWFSVRPILAVISFKRFKAYQT